MVVPLTVSEELKQTDRIALHSIDKSCKKNQTVSCFCLTNLKGSVVLILALQNNSTGLVLINDSTPGAGSRELKPGVAAPSMRVRTSFLRPAENLCL